MMDSRALGPDTRSNRIESWYRTQDQLVNIQENNNKNNIYTKNNNIYNTNNYIKNFKNIYNTNNNIFILILWIIIKIIIL